MPKTWMSLMRLSDEALLVVSALRKAMANPDKLTANRQTLDLLRDGAKVALTPGQDAE